MSGSFNAARLIIPTWLLFGMLVIGGVVVAQQTPSPQRGFKAGYVAALSSGEVIPDQMDNFKKYAKRVLAAVAEEPGTLAFEFSLHPDGKTVDLLEMYQNAEAFVAHVKHMRAVFKPEENPRNPGKIVVFGSPNAEMKEILARRDPVYETYIDGFMR
jgi:quinol monooxygenase YgiN